MAISTMHTFLMHGTDNSGTMSWERLICITDFPDLGGEPENIDVTTLCDTMRKTIPGVENTDALVFNAWYTPEGYAAVKALEGTEGNFAVWFGGTGDGADAVPTGDKGKFAFKGTLTTFITGGGVNEAVGMQISIFPTSKPTLEV